MDFFTRPVDLEQQALKSLSSHQLQVFERRVVQLKALYRNDSNIVPTETTFLVIGQYLLYLLASDRIADFHTELESISTKEQSHKFIQFPIQLERYIMEGNYAKVLSGVREKEFDVLYRELQGAVQAKQLQTRSESAVSQQSLAGTAAAIDSASAWTVLSNMVGYATDLERIIYKPISDRGEISRLRRQLTHFGREWDLMWELKKLREEVSGAIKTCAIHCGSETRAKCRHQILHIRVDRITCYLRNLTVGLFKIRVTQSFRKQGHPVILESRLPFLSGRCLSGEDGYFRLSLPVKENQLLHRIEFEVLHKFPAAPVYSVVARAWVSQEVLVNACAIDLFSTVDTPTKMLDSCASIRLDFLSIRTSDVAVNLFRVAAKVVICTVRAARALAARKREETKDIEREISFLKARNLTDRQDLQLNLLMKTVEVMNKYMDRGSRPDEWIASLQRAGAFGAGRDEKIESISSQLEHLRNDVLKALVERPPVVQYVKESTETLVHPKIAIDHTVHDHQSKEVIFDANAAPTRSSRGLSVKEITEARKISGQSTPIQAKTSVDSRATEDNSEIYQTDANILKETFEGKAQADEKNTIEMGISSWWSALTGGEPSTVPKTSNKTEEAVEGKEAEEEVEGKEAEEVVDPKATEGEEEEDEAKEDVSDAKKENPKIPEPKKASPKPPVKKASVVAKLNAAPLIEAVTVKKAPKPAVDPKTKAILEMKAKQEALRAKLALVAKIKALEAKRKVEIDQRAAAIEQFAKKLPPVDSRKFIGLPGPPPFAPKAKAKVPSSKSVFPTALAPSDQDEE